MTPGTSVPPGLDLDRLHKWLSNELPSVGGTITAQLIAGGKSNLTFAVTDGAREWIVRRPPLGHVLATAHDMVREYRVLFALQNTAVPVPRTYALCSDESVLGARFFVMERCAGTPYRKAEELAALGSERIRTISERLVDILVALHDVDPLAVGLEGLGRPEGFLGRQVSRWKKQLDASAHRSLPGAEELYRRLCDNLPPQSDASIVHGDFRLDNLLVDDHDQVTAVLDWEMATLGDPLTDLALMLIYHRLGGTAGDAMSDVAAAPGFLTEDEIIGRYAEESGRDCSSFGFYLALAAFKLAAILEGIHYRHLQGQTVGRGYDHIGAAVPPLLAAGLDAIEEYI